ncbi:TetR family transcriptional regulator C-terminal domain-containing protein [Hoeflea sp. BAL378]|uniref:TetR/AcrR family transcriptional regulator n=1 Tax=Hoeflea sp. BAL378 TaxID=1547437 RepID=UPI0009E0A130|nr:TetR family transcriptional regulator C-terminal domain-containing protein [Hoeflea sp. BAL378]
MSAHPERKNSLDEIPPPDDDTPATRATEAARRREPKALRREQLINATIDSLAKRGYAATTLADVADGAGLSRGIVNFHFTSKDNLLSETIKFLQDEYTANWQAMVQKAAPDTASQLLAMVTADLDRKICTHRKLAAWFALITESRSKPAYQEMAWDRDAKYRAMLASICLKAKVEGGYAFDPQSTADAIYAMQEGLWLRMMLFGRGYKREAALGVVLDALCTIFPRHFAAGGTPLAIKAEDQ